MKFLRWAFILGFSAGVLYHLFYAFIPRGDVVTGERHLLFVLINIVAIILLAIDHPRALLAFVPLILEQLYSHGAVLLNRWQVHGEIDWPSVIVLIAMPALATYVFKRNFTSSADAKNP